MSDEILLERLLDDSYPGYLESEQQLIDIQNKIKDRIDRFEALKNEDRSHRIREAAASARQDGDSGFTLPGIDLFAEYNSTAAADGGAALETGEDDAFFGSFSDAFSGNAHTGRNAHAHEGATGNSFDEEPDNAFADAFADVFAEAHGDAHSETSFKASREMFSQETASADEDFPDQFTLFDAAEIFTDKTSSAVIPSGEAFSGGAEKTSRAAAEQSREPVKTHTQNIFGQGPAEGRSEEYAQRPVTEGAFEKQNPWTTVEPSRPAAEIAKPGEEQPKPSAEWPRTAEQPKTTDEEQSEKPAEESSEEQIRAEDLPGEKAPKEEPAAGTSGEGDRSFDSILDSVRDRLRDKPKPAATSAAPGTRSDKRAGDAFSGRDSGRDPYREPKAAPQGAPGNPMKEPAGTAPNDREKEPARTAPNDREKEPAKAASGNSGNPVNEPVKRQIHNRGSANAGSQNREHADSGRRGTAGINPERDMYNAPSCASSGAASGASSGAYPGAASGASSGAPSDEKSRQSVIRVKKNRRYQLPPLDLVKPTDRDDNAADNEDLYTLEAERNAEKLKTTLRNFGIGVRITGITRGPAVTRFEFKPDEGIKISRIVALTNDIALSLAASAVRMEAPIPGKPAIGIEIPNKTASTVYIYDVLNTPEYRTAKSKLSVALGKDIDGRTVLADLNKMPHLLIAGSTGSGKSVCINTLIMGILFNAAPDEVKFIMIDPKVVELGIYNNIPHLLIPVVTEPRKASAALSWAVAEVERRYKLFAENNVRDLANYNRGIKEKPEMAKLEKIPQIVIIIDELADLMMAAPQDVEKSIIRLAQKARAAGVHLVIATQRPSVDVITGIIKANIPSRIAFAVASQIDSRTILDTVGAEKLLGRGDMLYHPLGFTKSVRVQCAFVSDEEVERVVNHIRNSYGAPEFDDEVTEAIAVAAEQNQKDKGKDRESDQGMDDADQDYRLICEAAELALSQGAISTSSLQRRMRLGYGRAARIIDSLEAMGLLSGSDGSKPRTVLMTKEQWKKRLEEENAGA